MTGGEILIESVKQLSDSADSGLQKEVIEILNKLNDDDVIAVTSVRARSMGSAASVDVVCEIPSVLTTSATSAVEERVRQQLLGILSHERKRSGVIARIQAKPYLEISMNDKHSDDEKALAKLAFEKFDENADGKLSLEELKSGLERTLKIKELGEDRVRKLMDEFDSDHDGYLELEEMVSIDTFISKLKEFSKREREEELRRRIMLDYHHDGRDHYNPIQIMPSTARIERLVRDEAKSSMYPKIRSIEGVTVHYTSQNSVAVDVNIRITDDDKEDDSLSSDIDLLRKAREYAKELKTNLESKVDEIESARVYLDLNEDDENDKKVNSSKLVNNSKVNGAKVNGTKVNGTKVNGSAKPRTYPSSSTLAP